MRPWPAMANKALILQGLALNVEVLFVTLCRLYVGGVMSYQNFILFCCC